MTILWMAVEVWTASGPPRVKWRKWKRYSRVMKRVRQVGSTNLHLCTPCSAAANVSRYLAVVLLLLLILLLLWLLYYFCIYCHHYSGSYSTTTITTLLLFFRHYSNVEFMGTCVSSLNFATVPSPFFCCSFSLFLLFNHNVPTVHSRYLVCLLHLNHCLAWKFSY